MDEEFLEKKVLPILLKAGIACLFLICIVFAVGYLISPEPGSYEENIFVKIIDTLHDKVNPFRTPAPLNEFVKIYDFEFSSNDLNYFDWAGKTAVEVGYLTDETSDWRSVVLNSDYKKNYVKLALRGDSADHWGSDKKSYKLKTTDELSNRYNIIILENRVYFGSIFAEWLANKLGLVTAHYEIALVKINGKPFGLYLIEESWNDYLLKREKLDKTIIKYSDEWVKMRTEEIGHRENWELDVDNAIIESDSNGKIYSRLATALQMVKDNDYENFDEYFDTDELAGSEAFRAIFGQVHNFKSDNLRLYYNKSNEKFSFVARSEGAILELQGCNFGGTDLLDYIISNPDVLEKRNEILEKLLENEDELFEYYNELEEKYIDVILLDSTMVRRSNKAYYYIKLNRRNLEHNVELLKTCLTN